MTAVDDAEHGFETSFMSMAKATTFNDVATQLSNLLHHIYRLSELAKTKHGGAKAFYAQLYRQTGGEVAGATLWARTFDAHSVVRVAEPKDVYTDVYTDLYGTLVWTPRSQLPLPDPKKHPAYGRDLMYDRHLVGMPVMDTALVAWRAIRSLI